MTFSWKQCAIVVVATAIVCAATASFGQSAADKLAEYLPKMAPENMADEGQVREMEAAQQGWMNYFLRDCSQSKELRAESIKATCDALEADAPTVAKAWLLNLLQWAGDDSCVDCVAKFLDSDEPTLVDASARALSQIPTEKALKALQKDPEKFAPYIDSRERDKTVGVETELPLALPYVSEGDFDSYMKGFDALSDDDKARALGAVRVRKAKKYVDLAVKSAASDNPDVKRAAILAIEKIGSAAQFDVLYKAMADFDRGFCVRVMKNIVGDDFDKAVVDALKKEKDGANMASLAEVVGGRYAKSEVGTLLALAKKDDCPARLALITAAEQIATKDNIDDFLDAALAISDRGDRDRAEQILSRLCEGDASPVIAKMTNANGAQIFPILGRVGGDAALEQIDRAANSNDSNAVALAVRSFCNWPNAVVWERLLKAAQSDALPQGLKVQALRAFVRVVSLPDDQDGIDMSGKDKVANLKKAFELATRDDERAYVLERVGSVREPESVEFALRYVDTPALAGKALNAILDVAHHDYMRKQNKELFLKALDVVIEKGDQGQKERAQGYKSNIR
ncbi:MAG: hypothetical protein IJM30_07220 [Thermoguttaceae bacterium]|nr:hypothetical protein [Thermoguttaceae bacterium]